MYKKRVVEKLQGFTQAPANPQKVCDENERRKMTQAQKCF